MHTSSPLSALFSLRIDRRGGYRRLARASALAEALGVERHVWLRGDAEAVEVAIRMGWTVHVGAQVLDQLGPDVLVIDDPVATDASRLARRARRLEIAVVALDDTRGCESLADVSVAARVDATTGPSHCAGSTHALVDWRMARSRGFDEDIDERRVLIALGSGDQAREQAAVVARALISSVPSLRIDVAAGQAPAAAWPTLPCGARWVGAPHGLASHMQRAAVVVTSGGSSMFEACAMARPVVALATCFDEARSVAAAGRAGFVRAARATSGRGPAAEAARLVIDLFADPVSRRQLERRAAQAVDGRGANRVADRVRELVSGRVARRLGRAA